MLIKLIKNIAVDIAIAAMAKPLPFSSILLALFNPIPPKIHPNSGIKKEQIKPAIA